MVIWLTGLAYGMLFFMFAAGLTLILGVMNIVNLCHGSFYLVSAYITWTLVAHKFNFWIGLVVAVIGTAILGVILERFLISRVYGKILDQVLLTIGLALVLADFVKWVWGVDLKMISVPAGLDFSIDMGSSVFPVYRLFIVLVGLVIAGLLWYFEKKTLFGAIVRAGVDDRAMVSALGINVGFVFSCVFAFGTGLAGLSGVLGAPMLGMASGVDSEILLISMIVVVTGGLGSWKGSFFAAILIGLVDTLGQVWFPSFSMALIFLIMIIVLLLRPSGLFGKGVSL